MFIEWSAFSSAVITPKGVAEVMEELGATLDEDNGWVIERNDQTVFVELATEDMEFLEEELLVPVTELLGDTEAQSRVALVIDGDDDNELGPQIARAVALAFSERWPIVLDDHSGVTERLVSRSRKGLG